MVSRVDLGLAREGAVLWPQRPVCGPRGKGGLSQQGGSACIRSVLQFLAGTSEASGSERDLVPRGRPGHPVHAAPSLLASFYERPSAICWVAVRPSFRMRCQSACAPLHAQVQANPSAGNALSGLCPEPSTVLEQSRDLPSCGQPRMSTSGDRSASHLAGMGSRGLDSLCKKCSGYSRPSLIKSCTCQGGRHKLIFKKAISVLPARALQMVLPLAGAHASEFLKPHLVSTTTTR